MNNFSQMLSYFWFLFDLEFIFISGLKKLQEVGVMDGWNTVSLDIRPVQAGFLPFGRKWTYYHFLAHESWPEQRLSWLERRGREQRASNETRILKFSSDTSFLFSLPSPGVAWFCALLTHRLGKKTTFSKVTHMTHPPPSLKWNNFCTALGCWRLLGAEEKPKQLCGSRVYVNPPWMVLLY